MRIPDQSLLHLERQEELFLGSRLACFSFCQTLAAALQHGSVFVPRAGLLSAVTPRIWVLISLWWDLFLFPFVLVQPQGFHSVPNTLPGLITASLTALICAKMQLEVVLLAWLVWKILTQKQQWVVFVIFHLLLQWKPEQTWEELKWCRLFVVKSWLEAGCWLIPGFSPLQPVTSPAPHAGELLRTIACPAKTHHTWSKRGSAWPAVPRGSTQRMASALVNTCERNALHEQESIFHLAVQQLWLNSCLTRQLHLVHSYWMRQAAVCL